MANEKDLIPHYTKRLIPCAEGGYTVSAIELPGCLAEGESADEAIANFNKAAESWMEAALITGYPIKPPIDFDDFSGKIPLKIPRILHKQVAELADLEGCHINTLLTAAIALYVGGQK